MIRRDAVKQQKPPVPEAGSALSLSPEQIVFAQIVGGLIADRWNEQQNQYAKELVEITSPDRQSRA